MSTSKTKKIVSKRPLLFSKGSSTDSSSKKDIILKLLKDTNFGSTSSFRWDAPGVGIKNTQQVSVDWSKLENHVFFDSAQSKINVAFDIIVNSFPFDGSKKEVEAFFDSLTGYENYIFSRFPKYVGYLSLSGARGVAPDTDGNWIEVFDSTGYVFPNFSSKRDGSSPIDFSINPFTIECQLYVPDLENDNQILFQKRDSFKNGVTVALSSSASTSECDIVFSICSGSSFLLASASVEKGRFNHIANIYDRDIDNKAKIYVNSKLVMTSSKAEIFKSLSFNRASFMIGSGSSFAVDSRMLPGGEVEFSPRETMSGSIDELRVFHSIRSKLSQEKNSQRSIYATPDLKLYFKFNEATGSYRPEGVVLDSSGNSLHSIIKNFKENPCRVTGSVESPMEYEKTSLSPILFPDHYLVRRLNEQLLYSGSRYDRVNPNIITRLVPPHLFLEGQSEEGFETLQGQLFNPIKGQSIPGSLEMGSAQRLTAFLFIYAKMFDEIKIVLDTISNFLHVSYDEFDTVPDQLIPAVAKYYGIDLPSLFSNSTIFEFIDGEGLGDTYAYSRSLRDLQNQLWKRFLINLPYVLKSKGTLQSVKSTIRSFGINPDSLMNIREFGGPTKKSLESLRQNRIKDIPLLDFSSSMGTVPGTEDYQGFASNIPHIVSPFLSGSRIEPGYPNIQGEFVNRTEKMRNGISNNAEDGLHTSGSFTYEAYYRFLRPTRTGYKHQASQSLARICVTGSSIDKGAVLANLVACSGSNSSLRLFVRSSLFPTTPGIKLELTGTSIFNGDPWYVSFGRTRSDDIITSLSKSYLSPMISTNGSSSYFLRCSRVANGRIVESHETKSFLKDFLTTTGFENMLTSYNVSGTFIVIGSQSLGDYGARFLNDTSLGSETGFDTEDNIPAKVTDFSGQVGKIRFWSTDLGKREAKDHALNPASIGSKNPNINYNFVSQNTGSFQRARLDIQLEQPATSSDSSGEISLTNFTQTVGNFSGRAFEPDVDVIKHETMFYSMLSPKFDLSQTDDKIRVRSYNNIENIEKSDYASSAPVYEVRRSEEPDDDNRFAIEFSSVKALDEDIMSIFSDLIFFDNAIGKPSLIFDEIYPDLDQARKVYFRRLFSKPEFQNYFSMFKWFNNSFGYIIEQLIPRNTKFLGIDFVYESHPLERNRFRYLFDDIYLLSNERSFDRGDILLSQFVGDIKKF